jgi:hypothetical protein
MPVCQLADSPARFFDVVLPDTMSSTRLLISPSNRTPGPIRPVVISPGSVAKPTKTTADEAVRTNGQDSPP